MTQDDILKGRLICDIGIAPVHPIEFVNFGNYRGTHNASSHSHLGGYTIRPIPGGENIEEKRCAT